MLGKCKDRHIFLIFKHKFIFCLIFGAFFANFCFSQTSTQRQYIEKYRVLAIEHMREHGIPASITLGQGLLESGSGTSKLAREGNNHFGVKCYRTFRGDSIYIGSTCYRRYTTVEDSYLDHSNFLHGQRYSSLFNLHPTDYKGWARGIKACGYATDPSYAVKLIQIIEMCNLAQYDRDEVQDEILAAAAPRATVNEPAVAQQTERVGDKKKKSRPLPDVMHDVHRKWGLHCVRVVDGDTWDAIAREFNMKTSKLLGFNDVKEKNPQPPVPGSMVYLEKKNRVGQEGYESYNVREHDTLWSISQAFGIRVDDLAKLNELKSHEIALEPGTPILLR